MMRCSTVINPIWYNNNNNNQYDNETLKGAILHNECIYFWYKSKDASLFTWLLLHVWSILAGLSVFRLSFFPALLIIFIFQRCRPWTGCLWSTPWTSPFGQRKKLNSVRWPTKGPRTQATWPCVLPSPGPWRKVSAHVSHHIKIKKNQTNRFLKENALRLIEMSNLYKKQILFICSAWFCLALLLSQLLCMCPLLEPGLLGNCL